MKKPNKSIYIDLGNGKKGYRLGHMDLYSVAVWKTPLENSSFYHCFFDEEIKEEKLISSINKAFQYFPLFKTRIRHKKEYYLEENDLDVSKVVKHVKAENRPKTFGSVESTNGYLFQISYFDKEITFEWCHAVTDGRGALEFFSKILDAYFDVDLGDIPSDFPLGLPYETIYDNNEKGFGQVKQEPGFKAKNFKLIKNGYKCRSTTLRMPASDVLRLSKRIDATPVAVLTPIICKAIRSHIPEKVKNRNVSCGIVVDGRKALNFPTMHNCIFNKVITYTDKMDSLDIQMQGTIYRSLLDLFCQKENLTACATEMMNSVDSLYRFNPPIIERGIMKVVAPIVKQSMNNIAFTYIGRVPFSEKVKSKMVDFRFRSWPDIGGCVCAMADLNGTLILDVTDNYKDEHVIDTFIELCKGYDIKVEKSDPIIFEQANVRV